MIKDFISLTVGALFFYQPLAATYSSNEINIVLNLFDYLNTDYLLILDDNIQEHGQSQNNDLTYPPRKMTLTAVLTASQLVSCLIRDKTRRTGVSMVVARQESPSWEQFKKSADVQLFRGVKWLLFTHTSKYLEDFSDIYIPFDCEFLVVDMSGSLPKMIEVYHIGKNTKIRTSPFGYWEPDLGFSASQPSFYLRRPDFKGHTFTGVVRNMPPYTFTSEGEGVNVTISGYFFEVWKELEHRLKFNTNYRLVGQEEDKELITSGQADFVISPVVQEPSLAQTYDFTEPIYESKINLFGNRPGSELEWNSYLKPFSTETWLAMICWMLVSAIALFGLYYTAWKYQTSEIENNYFVFNLSTCLETVFRAACAQGSEVTPKSAACRLMFLSIYITALVVTSAFSAALFSLLTIPTSKAPFNTFAEITSSQIYKLSIVPDSDVYKGIKDLAERFPESDHSKLYKMLEPLTQLPSNVTQALERVCNRKDYVFMWDLPNVLITLQNMTRDCREKIMPGGPLVFREHLGFATAKNSPFKKLIDQQIVRLKNEGVLRRLLLATWPPRIPNVQTSWVRVTISDISPILYMFGLGVVLGTIFLTAERFHKQVNVNEKKQSTPSSSQTFYNLKRDLNATPLRDPWTTKYTDWTLQTSLHYRGRDKWKEY